MMEWLSQQSAGQMVALCGVVGGISVAIVAIASAAWARVRKAEYRHQQIEAELALKQQMIEKGLSADDIERVLAAGKLVREPDECATA